MATSYDQALVESARSLADLHLGHPDWNGEPVQSIYAKYPPHYAVYLTPEGVRVGYSDDPATADKQRSKLAALGPLRGEIAGLLMVLHRPAFDGLEGRNESVGIDGLNTISRVLSGRAAAAARGVERYHRRVADALVVALQATVADAVPLFGSILADIKEELAWRSRRGAARTGAGLAFVICAMAAAAAWWALRSLDGSGASTVLTYALAAGAGALGAFVSTVQRARLDRFMAAIIGGTGVDVALSVATGVIAALLFQVLLGSGLITIGIGDLILGRGGGSPSPVAAIVTGFLAGFAERLVPTTIASVRVTEESHLATIRATATSAALEDVRQVVADSVQASLAGPELIKFNGYVAARLTWAEAVSERLAVVTLHFSNVPEEGSARLLIKDGLDRPAAPFVVECEPEGSPRNLATLAIEVPTMEPFTAPPIKLSVPEGTEKIWVELLQQGRVIQTFPIALPSSLPEA